MPSAQARPRSGREEGCDFVVLSLRWLPRKVRTGPRPLAVRPPWPWGPGGLQIRGAETHPGLVSGQSGALGQAFALGLGFPKCMETGVGSFRTLCPMALGRGRFSIVCLWGWW